MNIVYSSRLADRYSVWDPQCFENNSGKPYRLTFEEDSLGNITSTTDYDDPQW